MLAASLPTPDKHTMHDLLLRMGMVFQSFNLFPHMTVLENIMVAPRMVKGMKDTDIMPIAERLLNKVGLWDKRDMYPSRLLAVNNSVWQLLVH